MNKTVKVLVVLGVFVVALPFLITPILIFTWIFFLQPIQIKGNAMDPHYRDGQYYMVNKFIYRFSKPKQGEVIYFESPFSNNNEISFLKRVIGLPGDRIRIQSNQIYVNDVGVDQNYFKENNPIIGGQYLNEGTERIIPENQ